MDIVTLWPAFMVGMACGAICIIVGSAIGRFWLRRQYKVIFSKLLRHRRNGRGR